MITEREKSAGKTTNCESKLPNGKTMIKEKNGGEIRHP
jgi:hypothetical protein